MQKHIDACLSIKATARFGVHNNNNKEPKPKYKQTSECLNRYATKPLQTRANGHRWKYDYLVLKRNWVMNENRPGQWNQDIYQGSIWVPRNYFKLQVFRYSIHMDSDNRDKHGLCSIDTLQYKVSCHSCYHVYYYFYWVFHFSFLTSFDYIFHQVSDEVLVYSK